MARQMKDSGIEWIGEIPACWELRPARYAFSEVKEKNTDGIETRALQFKFGKIIAKTNFNAEDDDYVADTITNYTIVEPGTVMINGLNLNYDFKTQRVALVAERGVITSAYLALRPDEQLIDAEYATYLFKGYESKMALHNMGAGIRLTLGYREFKNQPVLFPTLSEQRKIVAFLDRKSAEIDAVIERTKSTIEEYKKLKQAVITEAVTKGVRGPRPMKDSGIEWIGEIPEGWSTPKFGYVAEVKSNLVAPELYPNYVQISPENIDKGSGRLLSYGTVADAGVISGNHLFHEGQILYSKIRPKLNKVCIAPCEGLCSADMYPIETHHVTRFVMYCMLSDVFLSQVAMVTEERVKMPKINQEELARIRVAMPATADEEAEIVEYLDTRCTALDTLIARKTSLLTELETYKKSIIYEYVTGKQEMCS